MLFMWNTFPQMESHARIYMLRKIAGDVRCTLAHRSYKYVLA